MNKQIIKVWIVVLAIGIQSCSEFLESKPNLSLVVPQTLDDFQGLLDAEFRGMNWLPVGGSISSDEHVFGPGLIQTLDFTGTNLYFWEKEIYLPDQNDATWSFPYQKIFYANVVLDGLEVFKPKNSDEENRVRVLEAAAKFYRAMGHYDVLMMFSETYDPERTDQLGIPIKRSSDVNIKDKRATMPEVFEQIINDLESGLSVLPVKSQIPTRPSQWASSAMLSRVYLSMHNYEKAFEYAQMALAIDQTLMDYKSLESSLPYSFEVFNPEVIFHQTQLSTNFIFNGEYFVNPDLIAEYESSDLRLKYFFTPSGKEGWVNFRGNYSGDFNHFGGIAVDEVILNFAESAVRTGKDLQAADAIGYLLQNRYEEGFNPEISETGDDLLKLILSERRKELLFRGIRWYDLKRLNYYPELAITLKRTYNDGESELPPLDKRYALPIPPAELNGNTLVQNQR